MTLHRKHAVSANGHDSYFVLGAPVGNKLSDSSEPATT